MAEATAHIVEETETTAASSIPVSRVASIQVPLSLDRISRTSAVALQRSAGNGATGRLLAARATARELQRCGSRCHCTACSASTKLEEDEPILEDGGRLLRQAVADRSLLRATTKSKAVGGKCMPKRTISGVVFVPAVDDEIQAAQAMIDDNARALSKQNISLDLALKPFLELGNLVIENSQGQRTVDSYDQVCALMYELEERRTKPGIVVLFVPISGAMCEGDGEACYLANFRWNHCSYLKSLIRLIIIGRFTPASLMKTVLAHELGHHAGRSTSSNPTYYGHEPYDKGNYMGAPNKDTGTRDHYRSELLDRMCRISFQF